MTLVTFLAMFLFIPSSVIAEVSCFSYGSGMGAPIISCDGPRGNTTITPLPPSQGIIQSDQGGLEPYTVFPPSSSQRKSFSSQRDSFSSHPIEPLRRLDRVDRLDRLSDPLSDPLLPLLLGE
jgi:hypothetical protein